MVFPDPKVSMIACVGPEGVMVLHPGSDYVVSMCPCPHGPLSAPSSLMQELGLFSTVNFLLPNGHCSASCLQTQHPGHGDLSPQTGGGIPVPSPILSLLFCRWKAVTHPKTRQPSPSAPLPAQRPVLPSHCPTGTWRRTEPSGRARRRAARAPKAGAPRRTRRRAWRMERRAGRWRMAAAPPRRAWTPRPMRVSWPLPTPRRNAGGGNSWRPQRKVRSERSGAPTAPPGTPGPCPSCWGTGGSTRGGRGGGRRALCLVGGKGPGGLEGRPPACAHACAVFVLLCMAVPHVPWRCHAWCTCGMWCWGP